MLAEASSTGAAPVAPARAITGIDCHAHVMEVGRPLSPDRHSAPIRDATVEEYLALLDRHGISQGLLTAPSFYGTDNSLLLEALGKSAGRLRGTVIVEPAICPETLTHMREQGVCGVRLNWIKRDTRPDAGSAAYQQLFRTLRDLGMHVEIFLEGPHLETVLPQVAECGVNVVLDHFGCPDPAGGVESAGFKSVLAAVDAGRTWVKLSAPYRLGSVDPQRYVDALLDTGGPGRLVWATDWPWVGHEKEVTYAQCIDWLRAWIPDDRTRHTVLVDTPRDLFGY